MGSADGQTPRPPVGGGAKLGNPVVLAPPQGLRVGTLGEAMLCGAYLHSHQLFPISNVTPLGES